MIENQRLQSDVDYIGVQMQVGGQKLIQATSNDTKYRTPLTIKSINIKSLVLQSDLNGT